MTALRNILLSLVITFCVIRYVFKIVKNFFTILPEQEQFSETTREPYPSWVCDDCGIEANRQTCLKKYGAVPIKKKFNLSCYHIGKCEVCGETKDVTEPRDFFYPDFRLLVRTIC